MMNIQSTGASDAATSAQASSSKKTGESNDGFSEALSSFDKDAGSQKAAAKDGSGDEQSLQQDDEADAAASTKRKPIIDLRPESLRKAGPVIDLQDETIAAAEAAKGGKDARELTAAEKKLKEALATAKALAAKSDAAEQAKGTAGADETDVDIEALLAGGKDVELSDILSLLNGQGAAAALDGMVPGQKGNGGQGGKRDGDDIRGKGNSAMDALSAVSSRSDDMDMPGDAQAATGDDRVFRFQGNKGERNSVDMVVGDSRSERSAEFRNSSGNASETVTVLDARRFIGLAPNSSALTSALSGDKGWVAAMQSSAAAQAIDAQNGTGGVVNTLKLQMTPHDLGSVTAMLRLHGEQLNVHLTVETRAAYRQLADDSSGIMDALKAQGFAVDQVTISIAPTADSDTANNSLNGQNGQQAASEGNKQGAANRGQDNAAGGQSFDDQAGNGNDGASENQAASSSGNARPGQLYL